jgi:hypothetical protein
LCWSGEFPWRWAFMDHIEVQQWWAEAAFCTEDCPCDRMQFKISSGANSYGGMLYSNGGY